MQVSPGLHQCRVPDSSWESSLCPALNVYTHGKCSSSVVPCALEGDVTVEDHFPDVEAKCPALESKPLSQVLHVTPMLVLALSFQLQHLVPLLLS